MLYVPAEHVTREHIDAFTYKFEKAVYEKPDNVTRKCLNCKYWKVPWKDFKGSEVLCHLNGYTESDYCKKFDPKPIKRIEEVEIVTYAQPNNELYTFGRGNLGKIENVFHDFEIIDQRSAKPLGIDLQLKEGRQLYPEQVKIVQDWLDHGYGVIKSPTGSGKTLMWTYLVSHLKMKTILLAQEVRHLQVGFEGLYEHTNIAELEDQAKTKLCGRLGHDHYFNSAGEAVFKKSRDPGKTYPITFSTFQALNSKSGKAMLNGSLKDEFGLLWLEECLAGSTLVPTSKGIVSLQSLGEEESKDLEILVGTRYGVAPTSRWVCHREQPTLKVETYKGHSYIGTADHKMLVMDPKNFELGWTETKDLRKGDLLCISPRKTVRQEPLDLPKVEGIQHPEQMTVDLAFLIGSILSVGVVSKTGIYIVTKNGSVISRLERTIKDCFGLSANTRLKYPEGPKDSQEYRRKKDSWELSITDSDVLSWFNLLGLEGITKAKRHVPWSILQADEGSQLSFLSACISCSGRIRFCIAIRNQSPEFIGNLQVMFQALGYHSAWLPWHKKEVRLYSYDSYNYIHACRDDILCKYKMFIKVHFDKIYGIPAGSIVDLINSKRIPRLNRYRKQDGTQINVKSVSKIQDTMKGLEVIPYDKVHHVKYKEILRLFSVMDPEMFDRFETLASLKYRFVKVKSITPDAIQTVYDLTLKDPKNRSFTANGLISSNCHHESAETFHHVTKSFNSYYKGGQSATPTRKDNTHVGMYDTIGPVTAIGTKEQMVCQYMFINTGVIASDRLFYGQYPLPKLFTFLSTNTQVQECILQWMLYDIQQGRKPLYITERKADAFSLRDKIHMSGYNVELIMGGAAVQKKQSEYSERLQDGSLHAIIGTKVIKENYNIPPLDTLHLAYPNFGVESEEQMTGRIRRYLLDADGKPLHKNQPLIRVYMVESNNTMIKKSKDFRRNFYKKMSFEEITLEGSVVEGSDKKISSKKW